MKKEKGLSLIEFLVYFAILSLTAVVLVTLMINTIRDRGLVQSRAEVQANMRSAILRINRAVQAAKLVNGTPGATLSLAMKDSSLDPTVFDVSSFVLRITEGAGSAQALTSDKVKVTSLTFTKISNPSPAKATIKTEITIEYKDNGNPQLKYSQSSVTTASLKQ